MPASVSLPSNRDEAPLTVIPPHTIMYRSDIIVLFPFANWL